MADARHHTLQSAALDINVGMSQLWGQVWGGFKGGRVFETLALCVGVRMSHVVGKYRNLKLCIRSMCQLAQNLSLLSRGLLGSQLPAWGVCRV